MDEENLSYWERRKAQRMFEYMQSAEDTSSIIQKGYFKATGYINHQLDEIYDRFKTKHHLSESEARRLLNMAHDKTSYDELLRLIKQESNIEEKAELLKLLESPAYSARIQRLQSIQQELDVLMQQQYHLEKDRTTRHYTSLIDESYYKSMFDIQKDTGLAFSFSKLIPKQIDSVLKSKWLGINYSERIWKNTNKLSQDIKEELLISLLTGKTEREVADVISNKFSTGAMEARRLVRTESCYIVNEMEQQSYEACDIEYYRFVATLDLKTSDVCREHDMKRYPVSKRQPGTNCPPMHPWCRSTTIADIDDDVLKEMTRRARDPETEKLYTVPADMSYEQWYEKYVANNPNAKAFEKAMPNIKKDKEQYERYKAVFRDDKQLESFEIFKDMKYNDSGTYKNFVSKYKLRNQKDWEQNVISKGAEVKDFLSIKHEENIPQWMHDQASKWTEEERNALNYYTTNNFVKMNQYLRGKTDASSDVISRINSVKSAIKKSDIEQNIIVWRGTSFSNLIEGNILKETPLTDWPGLSISDKAFSSTSIIQGSEFDRELNLEILLPKGSNGAYISAISEYKNEYEMLLENNAVLQILEAKTRGGKYFIKVLLRKSGD